MGSELLHIVPILIVGALSAAISIERGIALIFVYPIRNQKLLFEKLRELVLGDRIPEAIALCDKYKSKLATQVVKEALLRINQAELLIEDALQLAVSDAVQKVQARTPFLATFANVSTLLGLLGTILGLIHSFQAVGTLDAQSRSSALAAGISTAMNATMMGLAVAIPSMLIYSYLVNRSNRLNAQIDQAAVRALNLIRQRYHLSGPDGHMSDDGGRKRPAAPSASRVA